ncbi:hypothetical protein R1sor_021802 [Riccia sorocarpa]|uniref:Uncharacterized protein n=1 Tax=Riccia sorocarpa TaxID=122646 RepID=A0ABD3GJI8_9MARC
MGKSMEDTRFAISPQSIWSTNSSWSASWSESASSSKQSSETSSPSTTASASEIDAWDLLNEVAGEVERLKMNEDRMQSPYPVKQVVGSGTVPLPYSSTQANYRQPNRSGLPLLSPPTCSAGTPVMALAPLKELMPSDGSPQDSRSWSQFRGEDHKSCNNVQHRFSRNDGARWSNRQGRGGQSSKGVQQRTGRQNQNFGAYPRTSGKSGEWNGLQPQWAGAQSVNGGSGMRAVFLGNLGSGRESTGTGVFLPRSIGAASDSKRKPACSAVLLPSRIVQVLNLNVDDMRSPSSPLPAGGVHSPSEYTRPLPSQIYGVAPKRDSGVHPAPLRKLPSTTPAHRMSDVSTEFSLPSEWTY